MENPYWDAVQHAVKEGDYPWEGPMVGRFSFTMLGEKDDGIPVLDRHDYVDKYAWTITDPVSVQFVAAHAGDAVVDPLAGTGYWAYLLRQLGIEVVCYDIATPETNNWHRDAPHWVEIVEMDGADAAAKHADKTLLLAWPPYSQDVGTRVLRAYRGERVIYIGEHNGCCGDDDMRDELYENWTEVAERSPVQWWGLHDRITVYERTTSEVVETALVAEELPLHTTTERVQDMPGDNPDRGDLVSALQGGSA